MIHRDNIVCLTQVYCIFTISITRNIWVVCVGVVCIGTESVQFGHPSIQIIKEKYMAICVYFLLNC